jgi:hypothetical protein
VATGWPKLIVLVYVLLAAIHSVREFENLHFVTDTACLAKPARFHTNEPSFGSSGGVSRLMSLYDAALPL